MTHRTKHKRRSAAELRRQAERRRRQRQFLLLGTIAVAFIGLVTGAALALTGGAGSGTSSGTSAQVALSGQAIPILGRDHVPEGTKVEYNSNPPSSGPHWPAPAAWGVYSSPLPDEQLVHNLEHGGIWISYEDVDEATRQQLETLARKYPEAVILTPRPQNDGEITLTSWGRIEVLDAFDEQRIVAFISANINQSPEKFAGVAQPGLAVGKLFPDFAVTEVDGRVVTRDSLHGKPAIVWFTTSYCIPCQIGAREVAKLDDELGGQAFTLLVIFVDPQEPPSALRSWRNQFARDDWLVASDTRLATTVGLRFLDTKYLLDEAGVIQNVDFNVADENYVRVIRRVVDGAG